MIGIVGIGSKEPSIKMLGCILLLAVLTSFPAAYSEPKVDQKTGRIRLLIIGECTPYYPYFVTMYPTDPRIDLRGVITAGDYGNPKETARCTRIFMPRTRQKFLDSLDVVELVDFVPWVLQHYHIQWIHDAVGDHGFGMTLCQMGWYPYLRDKYTSNDPEAWMGTVLYEAYPVDMIVRKQNKPSAHMDVVEKTCVVNMPDFERTPIGGQHGLVFARPGSTVHSRFRVGHEDAIVSRKFGRGMVLYYPSGWNYISEEVTRKWIYFPDFVLNQIYFVADVPVPEDPELAHALRASFKQYIERKTLITSLIDFIDKFGANTNPLQEMIDGLEDQRRKAGEIYLSGDYQGAWDAIHGAMEGLVEVSQESVKLRKKALLWVYITEYLTVAGSSLVCGFIVWTLMVKRKYYREVATTRLISREE